MKFLLLSAGKTHDKIYVDAIQEFSKRLQNYYATEWKCLQIRKNTINNENAIKKAEAELILSVIAKEDYVILLDEKGKMLSSPQLAQAIQQNVNESIKRIVFVIGGAYGVDKTVWDRAKWVWSLSPLVFPHQLVRLILVEQLYRACTIQRNEKYHHS